MARQASERLLNRVMADLIEVIKAGGRCPVSHGRNADKRFIGGIIPVMAAAGLIRIEIFSRNFRRIVVARGPYAGRHTANPPGPWVDPWKVIDSDGTREHGVKVDPQARARQNTESSAARGA